MKSGFKMSLRTDALCPILTLLCFSFLTLCGFLGSGFLYGQCDAYSLTVPNQVALSWEIEGPSESTNDNAELRFFMGTATAPVSNLLETQLVINFKEALPTGTELLLHLDDSWAALDTFYQANVQLSPLGNACEVNLSRYNCLAVSGYGLLFTLEVSIPAGEETELQIADGGGLVIATMIDHEKQDLSPHSHLYPNPVSEELNVGWEQAVTGEVWLRNGQGQVVLHQKVEHAHGLKLSVDKFQAGLYFLTLVAGSGLIETRKVLIVR